MTISNFLFILLFFPCFFLLLFFLFSFSTLLFWHFEFFPSSSSYFVLYFILFFLCFLSFISFYFPDYRNFQGYKNGESPRQDKFPERGSSNTGTLKQMRKPLPEKESCLLPEKLLHQIFQSNAIRRLTQQLQLWMKVSATVVFIMDLQLKIIPRIMDVAQWHLCDVYGHNNRVIYSGNSVSRDTKVHKRCFL